MKTTLVTKKHSLSIKASKKYLDWAKRNKHNETRQKSSYATKIIKSVDISWQLLKCNPETFSAGRKILSKCKTVINFGDFNLISNYFLTVANFVCDFLSSNLGVTIWKCLWMVLVADICSRIYFGWIKILIMRQQQLAAAAEL